ncbi:hypothetical protein PPYR_03693 [Photinus pyralis]|uniref:Protein sleepless n=1 Tax=Photinus pyralis TaxID=7054 RepID=A0A5N4A3J2_PHOPY|nr:uncharacterized protein LOC116161825 [Photinus pyralis]KAB0791893.1 hypothetical protein PPYR_03693 [Photinus pyralis]
MYIKTLLATLFLVHAAVARLHCYECDSSKGHTNCQSGSGIDKVECEEPPQDAGQLCVAYSENVNGVTKYVRECAIEGATADYQTIPLCPSMKEEGRDLPKCETCGGNYCNDAPL